jgi:TolB-like protein
LTESHNAVFLSYASQDAQAAERICATLRAAGIEVWFDQAELRGGDVWDQAIRRQIKDCALFIPVISATTASRREGYFRLEWDLADQRTRMIARDRAFIVPVCIDSTPDSGTDVPESFVRAQWTRLPAGQTSAAFAARISELLSPDTADAPPPARAATDSAGCAREPARRPSASTGRKRLLLLIAAVVLIGGGYFALDRFVMSKRGADADRLMRTSPARAESSAVPQESIAVLPFVDMSEKHDQEYFSDGLSEELIDLLVKVPELQVPARTSSFYFKGRQATIAEIAKLLGVAYVLEGSVRKSGDKLRVTAQLIRASDGYHAWSQTYDRDLGDVFKIEDDVATTVVAALTPTLVASAARTVTPTPNLDAYTLYLQGQYSYSRTDKGATDVALKDFSQAVALDPNFASAWAYLGKTHVVAYLHGWAPREKACPAARQAVDEALRRAPGLVDVHLTQAFIARRCDWDWAAEGAAITRAEALAPQDPEVLYERSRYEQIMGNTASAIEFLRRSAARDPLNPVTLQNLGFDLSISGQFPEAETWLRKALILDPEGTWLHESLAGILVEMGRTDDALRENSFETDERARIAGEELIKFRTGRRRDADAALEVFLSKFAVEDPYSVAGIFAARAQADEAFKWLGIAIGKHQASAIYLKTEPDLVPLHSDPRWAGVLRRMNLPLD